jgi:hypothetical protein
MTTQISPMVTVTQPGYKWSIEAADKAKKKGAFIRVGGKQVTRRFLSGALRSWGNEDENENRTIFHTGYRITGTPEAVTYALRQAGYDDQTIQEVLDTSITKENYDDQMLRDYQEELDNYSLIKKEGQNQSASYSFEDIKQLAQLVKNQKFSVVPKSGQSRNVVTTTTRGGSESLAERVKNLPRGKVLDVSNLDVNTGKGARLVTMPKTAKSGKLGLTDLPFISNNYNKYADAFKLVYGEEQFNMYRKNIEDLFRNNVPGGSPLNVQNLPGQNNRVIQVPGQNLTGRLSPPKQLTARTSSPSKQLGSTLPGSSLASVPNFVPRALPRVTTPRGGVGTLGNNTYTNLPALSGLGNQ